MKNIKKIIVNNSEVKRLSKSFSDFIDDTLNVDMFWRETLNMFSRPYIPISDDEYFNIMSITGENKSDHATDFVEYDGRVCSFGNADGGYALMPLRYEYATLVSPSQKRTENELTRVAYLSEYSHDALERIADEHGLELTDDGSFKVGQTIVRFVNEEGDAVASFLMSGHVENSGAIYRCIGVDSSLSANKKDEY